ncbi:hypothetical protein N9293_00470 [Planctomycetota bacterium]|nr:hypothetical protein [Planctomycetota bacterium]
MTPSEPKRLVLVCDLAKTYLRFRRPLFLAILEEGYEVHVVFTVASRDELSLVESDGMRGHVIPMDRAKIRPFGDLVYLMRLRYLLRKLQPSVLFSYQIKVAALSCLAARSIAGCRRFVLFPGLGFLVEQGSGPGRPGPVRALANVVFERAFRGVDGVLLQNSDDFDSLVELGIVSGTVRHTVVNGSGVPLEEFDAEPATEEPARFLMAGRLLATKGFREFVEAAKRLRAARGASVGS